MPESATPNPNAEAEREIARLKIQRQLEAEQAALAKERLKTQAELETARAGLVAAYGLPSFEGKTTLEAGAGAIEAAILATEAVDAAASRIVADIERPLPGTPASRRFLVLAGDEALDFGRVAALRAELDQFDAAFDSAQPGRAIRASAELAATMGLAAPVAGLKAIAGLLRTETTVTAVDHTAAFSHRVLATVIAGQLGGTAYLPFAASDAVGDDSPLIQRLADLVSRRHDAAAAARSLQPPESNALTEAIARFDAFLIRVTSPDAAGRTPLIEAARLEKVGRDNPLVLRVHVEKAGGSLINRTNLWTFFGFDPVKVSGGLVVSYTLTDPEDGRVLTARVLSGRTRLASLRKIQSGGFLARLWLALRELATPQPMIFGSGTALIDDDQGGSPPRALLAARRGPAGRAWMLPRPAPADGALAEAASAGATLHVSAEPSDNVRIFAVFIDGESVRWESERSGTASVRGTSGDGIEHLLNYTLEGPVGAKLTLAVSCAGREVLKLEGIEVFPAGEPLAVGWERFKK